MKRSQTLAVTAAAVVLLAVAAIIAGNAARNDGPRAARPNAKGAATPEAYDEEAEKQKADAIQPEMIGYKEVGDFPVSFREPRALALDKDGRILVAGDKSIVVFSPEGRKQSEIAVTGEPRCLAVGSLEHGLHDQLYAGFEDHVEVFDAKGEHLAIWPSAGEKAFFTSITTIDYEVWVADAGNRLIWRYDLHGMPLTPIGKSRGAEGETEFVVTNHYFDLATAHDDLVYVVNPRLLRVEGYTFRGERETFWGQGGTAVSDFFGCCNPAHLAVLPDGSFVTAEKGIPRVKTYSRRGEFQTVVVGPPQLSDTPAGVAGDRRGRVLVLDAKAAKVRIFEKKTQEKKP